MIHTFIGASDIQIEKQLRKTRNEVLKMAVNAVELAKTYCLEVEFSAMDASRTDTVYLYEIIQAAIEAGATVINIPDTVGYAMPDSYGLLIAGIFENIADIDKVRVSTHCHDDLGMATANALSAVKAGATQIECAVNGMGERAGNTSLEQVVMAIKTRGDYLEAHTDVNAKEITNTSRLVSRVSGFLVPPNKPIVGANAFSHSSGIHQDGVLKERATFEIMTPQDVGLESSQLPLTARSGRHALCHRLSELGYNISNDGDIVDQVYKEFLSAADNKKKPIDNKELIPIILSALGISVERVDVSEVEGVFTSQLIVKIGGQSYTWKGTSGTGRFDSIFQSINANTGTNFKLEEYESHNVTEGTESIALATMELKVDGFSVYESAEDEDTIMAVTKAYLKAVLAALKKLSAEASAITPNVNPQMIGKPEKLYTDTRYKLPKRPQSGRLLVGVGGKNGGHIVFFHVNEGGWRGGRYKSPKWLFFNTTDEATSVSFPFYWITKSGEHRYGDPQFWNGRRKIVRPPVVNPKKKKK
jgi:2-isopropylmalate synthase